MSQNVIPSWHFCFQNKFLHVCPTDNALKMVPLPAVNLSNNAFLFLVDGGLKHSIFTLGNFSVWRRIQVKETEKSLQLQLVALPAEDLPLHFRCFSKARIQTLM